MVWKLISLSACTLLLAIYPAASILVQTCCMPDQHQVKQRVVTGVKADGSPPYKLVEHLLIFHDVTNSRMAALTFGSYNEKYYYGSQYYKRKASDGRFVEYVVNFDTDACQVAYTDKGVERACIPVDARNASYSEMIFGGGDQTIDAKAYRFDRKGNNSSITSYISTADLGDGQCVFINQNDIGTLSPEVALMSSSEFLNFATEITDESFFSIPPECEGVTPSERKNTETSEGLLSSFAEAGLAARALHDLLTLY